jgi:hypothetical protein
MVFAVNSSLRLVRYLSNVHTWAIFFLRHLANTSSLVPFEHQLTPALSPIWGPGPKPRRPEEVVYSQNDSCSHFTQRLFPPKLPQQHTCSIFNIHSPSFILIIHHIQESIYILLLQDKITLSFLRLFLAGRLLSVSCVRYSKLLVLIAQVLRKPI